jgi:hypothetical protein
MVGHAHPITEKNASIILHQIAETSDSRKKLGEILMKIALLLMAILFVTFINPFQVQAAPFEELETKFRNNVVDSKQLNELLGKYTTAWDAFTPEEKQIVAKGAIISMDMETSEDTRIFQQHTQAAIRCMDTKGHGLNLRSSAAKILIGIGECVAKTYRQYCTICKP